MADTYISKGASITAKVRQADSGIVINSDDTMEAAITWRAVAKDDLPIVGELHPDSDKLECYNTTYTYNSLGYVTCAASYFGITGTVTTKQVSYTGGGSSEPIETYPGFSGNVFGLGGNVGNPNNGAFFDEETGQFLGFASGSLQGIQYYLTPSNTLTISYWMDSAPTVNLMQTAGIPPGSESLVLPDVPNWLLISSPVKNVGSVYQVTEQWLGSGPRGWNSYIYYPTTPPSEEE